MCSKKEGRKRKALHKWGKAKFYHCCKKIHTFTCTRNNGNNNNNNNLSFAPTINCCSERKKRVRDVLIYYFAKRLFLYFLFFLHVCVRAESEYRKKLKLSSLTCVHKLFSDARSFQLFVESFFFSSPSRFNRRNFP